MGFIISIQGVIATGFGGATMFPLVLYIAVFWNKMNLFNKLFHCLLLLIMLTISVIVMTGTTSLIS